MMEQPNLIKRPILVRGNRVTFGFKKDEYYAQARRWPTSASARRAGAIPPGKGTWNGIFYPAQAGSSRAAAEVRRSCVLRRALRHRRSELVVLPRAAAADGTKWAERTPPTSSSRSSCYQKFTHPDMFAKATGADPATLGRKDVDEFRAAIAPLAAAEKLGALLAQFPASFKNEPAHAPIWNGC